MFVDANSELGEIDAEIRLEPEGVQVSVQVYHALKKWELMQTVSKSRRSTTRMTQIGRFHGHMRPLRADSIEQARVILVNAIERTPNVAIFHFHLARCIYQLGELEEPRRHCTAHSIWNRNIV